MRTPYGASTPAGAICSRLPDELALMLESDDEMNKNLYVLEIR